MQLECGKQGIASTDQSSNLKVAEYLCCVAQRRRVDKGALQSYEQNIPTSTCPNMHSKFDTVAW